MTEIAANDAGPVPDLDVPPDLVPGEGPLPTDVSPPPPTRPRRGELHGADRPWGWADFRGAALRTVRREP